MESKVKPKIIYINASQVSVAMGKNKYASQEDFIASIWKSEFSNVYSKAKAEKASRMRIVRAPIESKFILNEIKTSLIDRLGNLPLNDKKEIQCAQEFYSKSVIDNLNRLFRIGNVEDALPLNIQTIIKQLEKVSDLKLAHEKLEYLLQATNLALDICKNEEKKNSLKKNNDKLQNHIKENKSEDMSNEEEDNIKNMIKNFDESIQTVIKEYYSEIVKPHSNNKLDQIKTFLNSTLEPIEETIRELDHKVKEYQTLPSIINSEINKFCGSRDEKKALDKIEEMMPHLKVTENNSKIYYKDINLYPFSIRIGGRVDGWLSEDCITEVKNRQNHLLKFIPPHEMIQIQIYLALTGARSCFFLEKYLEQTWTQTIYKNDKYWDNVIIPHLQIFVNRLEEINNDPSLQQKYIH